MGVVRGRFLGMFDQELPIWPLKAAIFCQIYIYMAPSRRLDGPDCAPKIYSAIPGVLFLKYPCCGPMPPADANTIAWDSIPHAMCRG